MNYELNKKEKENKTLKKLKRKKNAQCGLRHVEKKPDSKAWLSFSYCLPFRFCLYTYAISFYIIFCVCSSECLLFELLRFHCRHFNELYTCEYNIWMCVWVCLSINVDSHLFPVLITYQFYSYKFTKKREKTEICEHNWHILF